eukprot:s2780_g8.t1
MSQNTVTAIEEATLKAFLRKAQSGGCLQEILDCEASPRHASNASWDLIPGGAMTDGSKRQLSPDPEAKAKTGKTQGAIGIDLQLTSDSWKQLENAAKPFLPETIDSAFRWSNTVISFGKLKSLELCYLISGVGVEPR